MQRHLFLVGYDITCRKRRAQALHTVKGHAVGGQKSLYECWYTAAEVQGAMQALRGLIDPTEDRVFFLRLDERAATHQLGRAEPVHDADFFYVG